MTDMLTSLKALYDYVGEHSDAILDATGVHIDQHNGLLDTARAAILAATPPAPGPTAAAPKPKVWAVRIGYLETCFVERDAIVVATTAEEAQHRALLSQQIDSGEDRCQEVRECQVLGLVEDREPEELRAAEPDDLAMAERVRDDDEMRARFEDADEAEGPTHVTRDPDGTEG